ncbi:ACT domain-containing protein, partial [Halomonas sp. BM-2019]|uniref:ACT domain-containing protein n=1 Tax=Halomonas sp. BM-2019 TaxID=2811227 RepID=UPI0031FC5D14
VDMIVQNVAPAGDYTDFTFTVAKGDYKKTLKILEEQVIPDLGGGEVNGDDNIAKVSLVGVGMRSHAGVASKMFRVLADENINIRMVSTSEIKISVVIDEKQMELAVRALHTAFGLDKSDIEGE